MVQYVLDLYLVIHELLTSHQVLLGHLVLTCYKTVSYLTQTLSVLLVLAIGRVKHLNNLRDAVNRLDQVELRA